MLAEGIAAQVCWLARRASVRCLVGLGTGAEPRLQQQPHAQCLFHTTAQVVSDGYGLWVG